MKNSDNQTIRLHVSAPLCLFAIFLCGILVISTNRPQRDANREGTTAQARSVQRRSTKAISPIDTAISVHQTEEVQSLKQCTEQITEMTAMAVRLGMNGDLEDVIHKIAQHGNSAIPELESALSHQQTPTVRAAAARALAEIGTREAISVLLQAVLGEQNDDERRSMVSTLHALTNAVATDQLAGALLKTQDPIAFPTIRDTLARLADNATIRAIATAYHEDAKDSWQQSNLSGTILRIRSADAVPTLGEIVLNDPDFSFRTQAAISLGLIGTQDAIQTIVAAMDRSSSSAFTEVLVQALGSVNNKESLNDLESLLTQGKNENVRYAAALALANINNPASVEALVNAGQSESAPLVKRAIATSIARMKEIGSIPGN